MFLKILVLYDPYSTFVTTISDHLKSFSLYSKHKIFYASATHNSHANYDLKAFDVVIIHYCVRLSLTCHLSPYYSEELEKYNGLKVLFIQDEYETTETARLWFESLKIDIVFTCVPEKYREMVYPSARFPWITFYYTLTGFAPLNFEAIKNYSKKLSERKIEIGYRGRLLHYRYGNLAREKYLIAEHMKMYCEKYFIKSDIEYEDKYRIYGDKWFEFLGNCKATLGTESGSNIFDDTGELAKSIDNELQINPNISYEQIHDKYLKHHENMITMNQVSPRIFESIAMRTALILFEGKYSNILKPDMHYILLRKDFSNIDEVLSKLKNDEYLQNMIDKAYADVIESNQYSYQKFIEEFDNILSSNLSNRNNNNKSKNFTYNIINKPISMGLTNYPLRQDDLEKDSCYFETTMHEIKWTIGITNKINMYRQCCKSLCKKIVIMFFGKSLLIINKVFSRIKRNKDY